jgi:MFS family permease
MTEGADARGSVSAVGFAVAVTALGAMPVWMLSAYAPTMQQDLDFDSAALGLAIGAFFAVSTISGLPMGRLVQRLQWRRAVAVTAIIAGLSLVGVGLLATSYLPLVLLLSIGAIANSTSQPAGNLAIASNVRHGRQGLAFGIKQAALPISTFVLGLSVAIFDDGRAWRGAFLAAAGVTLAVLLAAALKRATRLWREHWRSILRPRFELPRFSSPGKLVWGAGVPVPRALVFLAVGAGFGTAVTISLGGFTVSYATAQGFSAVEAAQLLAFGSVVGIVSRVLSGYLADRRKRRHLVVVAAMMIAGAVGLVVLALGGATYVGLLVGVALAFGLGWAWNGVFHLSVVRYSRIPAAVATSIVQTAMSFGATLGPAAFGLIAAQSYTISWIASAIGLLVGAAFILLARRELTRST